MTHPQPPLDLDRLHDLALHGKQYRGQGSTTLALETLINEVLLCQVRVVYAITHDVQDAGRISRLIGQALKAEEKESRILILATSLGISTCDPFPTIRIVTRAQLQFVLKGAHDYALIDFCDRAEPSSPQISLPQLPLP
jgi:hypothetical protein